MKITLNGEPKNLDEQTTIALLVDSLELSNKRFAVEVNEMIVPRSRHAETELLEGDIVEIVVAIGGG